MKFHTAYYRQRNAETVSLSVQQAIMGKHRERVLFACICISEITWELAGFFSEEVIPMVSKYSHKALRCLGNKLEQKIPRGASFSAILCVEENALLMTGGEGCVYLLGKRFGKSYVEQLEPGSGTGRRKRKKCYREGVILEEDARILLTSEAVENCLSKEAVRDCLGRDGIGNEKQWAGSLADLGRLSVLKNGDRQHGEREFAMIIISCVEQGAEETDEE